MHYKQFYSDVHINRAASRFVGRWQVALGRGTGGRGELRNVRKVGELRTQLTTIEAHGLDRWLEGTIMEWDAR